MKKFKEILFLKSLKRVGKATIYGKYWDLLNNYELPDLIIKVGQANPKFSKEDLQKAKENAERIYNDAVNNPEMEVITVLDENYPKKLLDMGKEKPLYFYVKGNVDVLTKPNIAVIGTRKPSDLSKEFEQNLVKKIVNDSKRVVVSGLALGCDKIAHKTTVGENEITIAILPSGVNVIKPASNKGLAEEIINTGGCLVSEYEPDDTVHRGAYVERDKIVAAFCDATLVVECDIRSGTMKTVEAAKEYKRQIFCYLPDEKKEGSFDGNELILKNNADSIEVNDIDEFCKNLNQILGSKKILKSKQQTLDF